MAAETQAESQITGESESVNPSQLAPAGMTYSEVAVYISILKHVKATKNPFKQLSFQGKQGNILWAWYAKAKHRY